MHCVLNALRTQALGLNAQSYTNAWLAIDCHCGSSEFNISKLHQTIAKDTATMKALNIALPNPDNMLYTLFTAENAPLSTWTSPDSTMTPTLHSALTIAHSIAM